MSIIEVAKAAGVSTATVSRVLNDLPGVRRETARQVRDAVEALNYKPQRARRRRKHGLTPLENFTARTGSIAVIAIGHSKAWLQLPVIAAVVGGIQRGASEFGFRLMLDDMPDPTHPNQLVQNRQIDGAVVFISSMMPSETVASLLASMCERVPIVWTMGMEMSGVAIDRVTSDNNAVGHLAYSYLRARGCQSMAFLTANPDWLFMRVRGQAFLNAAFNGGTKATVYLVTEDEELMGLYGRRVVAGPNLEETVGKFAQTSSRSTGLFVANDFTTTQVHALLAKRKIVAGRDVTIVSCDNEETRLAGLDPRPASIDLCPDEIGFRAVVRLVSRLQRPSDQPLMVQVAPHIAYPPAEISR